MKRGPGPTVSDDELRRIRGDHPDWSLARIAVVAGVSRERIRQRLTRLGLPTQHQGYRQPHILVCANCGKQFERSKGGFHRQPRYYCTPVCGFRHRRRFETGDEVELACHHNKPHHRGGHSAGFHRGHTAIVVAYHGIPSSKYVLSCSCGKTLRAAAPCIREAPPA